MDRGFRENMESSSSSVIVDASVKIGAVWLN